jgi:hypothetical protein
MVAYGGNQLSYNAPTGGTYKLRVLLSDIFQYTLEYGFYINVINTRPDIISVTDIPGDEGLKVRVQWQYSLFDPPNSTSTVESYYLFRKVEDTTGMNRIYLYGDQLPEPLPQNSIVVLGDQFWDYIAEIPAVSPRPFDNYTYTAPTLKDSSETTFIVAAVRTLAGEPVLWGMEGTGISADNNAPEFSQYSINSGSGGITLSWDVNTATYPDAAGIKIYKAMYERFAPAGDNIIAVFPPSDGSFTDTDVLPGETYYYKMAIIDFAGNITYTPAVYSTITSVSDVDNIPDQILLKQNYPNPFNPSTSIEFSIPTAMTIDLKLFDVLGNELAEIARGDYVAGNHNIEFNSNSVRGGLSSGIYFYTLKAGSFALTKKLILLK